MTRSGNHGGTPSGDEPRFGSTDHLATEAIAAYVDGELRMNAYLRAARHISRCMSCASEVEAQQQARLALRGAPSMPMPPSLLGLLHQIPHCAGIDQAARDQAGRDQAARDPLSSEQRSGHGGLSARHGLGSVVGARFRRR